MCVYMCVSAKCKYVCVCVCVCIHTFVWKYLPPPVFFVHICHNWMIHIIKLILILCKENNKEKVLYIGILHKVNIKNFEIMISFNKGKKLSKPAWPYVKK